MLEGIAQPLLTPHQQGDPPAFALSTPGPALIAPDLCLGHVPAALGQGIGLLVLLQTNQQLAVVPGRDRTVLQAATQQIGPVCRLKIPQVGEHVAQTPVEHRLPRLQLNSLAIGEQGLMGPVGQPELISLIAKQAVVKELHRLPVPHGCRLTELARRIAT